MEANLEHGFVNLDGLSAERLAALQGERDYEALPEPGVISAIEYMLKSTDAMEEILEFIDIASESEGQASEDTIVLCNSYTLPVFEFNMTEEGQLQPAIAVAIIVLPHQSPDAMKRAEKTGNPHRWKSTLRWKSGSMYALYFCASEVFIAKHSACRKLFQANVKPDEENYGGAREIALKWLSGHRQAP